MADNTEMMRAHMWTHIGNAAAEVVITVGQAWVERQDPASVGCFTRGESKCPQSACAVASP